MFNAQEKNHKKKNNINPETTPNNKNSSMISTKFKFPSKGINSYIFYKPLNKYKNCHTGYKKPDENIIKNQHIFNII